MSQTVVITDVESLAIIFAIVGGIWILLTN